VEVVQAAFEAYLRGDERAVLELLADDVIIQNPRGLFDVPAVRHGRQGWRDTVAAFEEVFDALMVEVKELVDAGDWVLCVTRWTGRAGTDLARLRESLACGSRRSALAGQIPQRRSRCFRVASLPAREARLRAENAQRGEVKRCEQIRNTEPCRAT
jgi:ketosteroid isomerase-like protein